MKKEGKKDNKTLKKMIVNGLTLSRVAGTIAMPVLFNVLSAPAFIATIAAILFTDFLDGQLARKWEVSTIFGSVADMAADKLFGVAVLIALATIYPVMYIPLGLEVLITGINTFSAKQGAIAKSSELGRIKTWVIGLSMCALLITGMSPELIECLKNIKVSNLNDIINTNPYNIIEALKGEFKIVLTNILEKFNENKSTIETVAKTAAITSEALVATDYAIKNIKNPNKDSKTYKLSELIKNKQYRDYIKKVWLDEKYYKETIDMPLLEKLTPPELKEEVKVKKLTLDK